MQGRNVFFLAKDLLKKGLFHFQDKSILGLFIVSVLAFGTHPSCQSSTCLFSKGLTLQVIYRKINTS